MSNRREFLKNAGGAAAGVVFTGCSLLNAEQQSGAPRRRQVVVGAQRVKTIDVHAHCAVPAAAKLLNRDVSGQDIPLEQRLKAMDAQGIDMQALSINPFWYEADREVATQLIKMQNEGLAELCAAHPDRFVAFASAALQFPDLAAQQLEEGVRKLGLRGAAIAGHVKGEELSNRKFDLFWAKSRRAGRADFYASPPVRESHGRSRIGQAVRRQRKVEQRDRQSSRNHHLLLASDFRRNARPLSGAQDLRSTWRRLSCLLRRSLGSRLFARPRLQPHQEAPQRVFPGTALRRFAGLHTRGAAPLGRGVRREPYHDRHRFSVSLDDHTRRSRAQHAGVEQRGQACDFGRECGEALADRELEALFPNYSFLNH